MRNKLLLIGIDVYPNHPLLNSCVKDATDIKNVLLDRYNFYESDVYELYDSDATNLNIQNALLGYTKTIQAEENLIIYYSVHGNYDGKSDRGFWIPVDGTKDFTTWIPNETIKTLIEKINCKHIFLVSDSCFSNSLLITTGHKSVLEYSKFSSRWALASAFNQAYDSEKGSNSLFAETIIKYLENAQEDFRVTQLIENVKLTFSGNVLQKPQGSPLLTPNHRGGEYVFIVKQDLEDKRSLRGYTNFYKTLQHYRRSSEFREISTYEDKSNKVGFQLFLEADDVLKKVTYYLYLYEGASQIKTFNYLKLNHPGGFKDKNLLIFLPKENDSSAARFKLSNVEKKFKPLNIFYIDEFIRKQCTPKIEIDESSSFLNISNFILPSVSGTGDATVEDFIYAWLQKDSEPVLVVKGTGGIGKTTFAQFIADAASKKTKNLTVLFIDSAEIKDYLIKYKGNQDHIGIYNFYESLYDNIYSTGEKLSEDLFRINVDAGNILLIIDGLDEVISKIPNFDVASFINSIKDSSSSLGGGKVIITCRTHFWDKAEFADDKFSIIEIEPFTSKQALEFFQQSLESDAKIKKAVKMSRDFRYPNLDADAGYHPYVLDVIRSMVNSDDEIIESDLSMFSSKLLNNRIKNDYIIYRICDRERKRVGQISVDDQIRFFVYLANEKGGYIQTQHLRNEIQEALGYQLDNINVEALKSHPFLRQVEKMTSFRYDFLANMFKSIYIAEYFNFDSGKIDFTNSFIDIISENCWFGSAINSDIVRRVSKWGENDKLLISDIISQIASTDSIKIDKKRKVIANIFNLCLLINHRFFSNNIDANTALLKDLFEKTINVIDNLCIININTDQNVRFNFDNLLIRSAYIDTFGSFWECGINKTTRFQKCHLLNLKSKRRSSEVTTLNFEDCVYDKEVEDTIKKKQTASANNLETAKDFLTDFFRLFLSNGKLGRQWEDDVIKVRYGGVSRNLFDYRTTVLILKKYQILVVTIELGKNKFAIADNYKEDVNRFIKDGSVSKIISLLLLDFTNQ